LKALRSGFEPVLRPPIKSTGQIWHYKLARNFGNVSRRSTESVLMERLPQFDFVTVGIVYPGEAAVAFVLALRVDADAFFR
jgi:hypothetical protein